MLVIWIVLKGGGVIKYAVAFYFLDENSCPFHFDKLTFHNLAHYGFMGREKEGQIYNTLYYTKLHTEIINIYSAAKLDTPHYFKAELSQFVLIIRSTAAQDIHKRGDQYEVVKSPLFLFIYKKM